MNKVEEWYAVCNAQQNVEEKKTNDRNLNGIKWCISKYVDLVFPL